ncbi:MAG TPA: Rieske 2Fe-2S domain-containing protein [Solirubrobacteraceae bacterium]
MTDTTRHVLFPASDLPEGSKRIVTVARRSIGVMRLRGRLYALRNICPHHGAPLCEGTVNGTTTASGAYEYVFDPDALVMRCPWHGYEFELTSGVALVDEGLRVRTYRVVDEDGQVVLYA